MTGTVSIDRAAIASALARAEAHSPFLRRIIDQRPEIVTHIAAGDFAAARAAAAEPAGTPDAVARALRRERQALALTVAIGDLAGAMPFETVVTILSDFADRALDLAIRTAILERAPDAGPVGFAALALGKHGSRELNYSSDIDPILIFDPETLPRRQRDEPVEAAVRIARRVVQLLQDRTGDGYVLRVDLRLRPSPEASPLALPVDAALGYYESSALAWERAAFIRARAAAGDMGLGRRFLDAVKPFVWRRAVDYGAVKEVRGISRRIRDHAAQGQRLGPGFDLKKGRGGIREVEFFAQIHQLIHGGRDPALRAPATLAALTALAAAGRIDAGEAAVLGDAYRLYRTIEHRLQMVADQQTHSLPREADALDNAARLHGLADGGALVALLRPHVERVGDIYDSLDGDATGELSQDETRLEAALREAGFPDAAAARARIEGWRAGKMRALRTPAAAEALEAVLPGLVAALGRAPDPNVAINRFDDIVARLPSAINLFRLLEARPALTRMVADVLVHAPALSEALARRPALLDGLIDASAFDPPGTVAALAEDFAAIEAGDDYQALLDRTRRQVGERRFALGAQLIERRADPLAVGEGYSRVAEAAIAALGDATVAEFEAAHGRIPGGELVVLALGRLGGAVLTDASDLDIVFLFTGDHAAESDGRKPLGATQYFNRLAQRLTGALSVATPSGPLYEVDTRLRPSGGQGLLAVSTESFAAYQAESAWTWEHMALTRARPVYGSAAARAEVAGIVEATLRRPRDQAVLLADAARMRAEIARHKPAAGPLDVKLIAGGLVDCEFTVHVLQLSTGIGLDPRLRPALAALAEARLVAAALPDAYALMVRMLVTLRLVSPGLAEPPAPSLALVAQACGHGDWPALMAAYADARATVAAEWARVSHAETEDGDAERR